MAAVVSAAAMTSALASAAFAETYSTPGGEAAVGTNGSSANGQFLAVSDYGTANSGGLALSYLGSANGGLAGVSWTNSASGLAAFSGLGSANGALVGVSGTGSAYSPGVGISGTGPANGWLLSVSGTGNASSTTYNGVAVSGTGSASSGGNGVAVAPGGTAGGGLAGATLWGDSSGTAAVDPNRTLGEVKGVVQSVTSTGEILHYPNVNLEKDIYQSWVVATNPPDLVGIALKQEALAEIGPDVALNMAEGLLAPPGEAAAPSSSSNEATSSSTSSRPPSQMDLGTGPITYSEPYGCVPGAAYTVFGGMPGQGQLAKEMGTAKAKGTTFDTAAPVVNRHYSGNDTIYADKVKNVKELIDMVTLDVWRWGHGLAVAMDPAVAHWPDHRHANHAVTVVGYSHNSGGYLRVLDGYYTTMSDYSWGTRNGQGGSVPVPTSRRWYLTASEVHAAMKAVPADYTALW